MATPRKQQISLADTSYYHCISRCVRRAFLCGEDKYSGQSYEHRRGWIEEKLHFLTQVFAIDLCAYAVMSNHYHVVLFVDEAKAKQWTMVEVLERWHRLYKGTLFCASCKCFLDVLHRARNTRKHKTFLQKPAILCKLQMFPRCLAQGAEAP